MTAAPLPPSSAHPWFDSTASATTKWRAVLAQPRLTWQDYFTVCWSYDRTVPSTMKRAIAERLDVMSGPYEAAVDVPSNGSWDVPELLRVLLKPRSKERELWSLLFAHATPDGRRRLIDAYGDTEDDGYGSVWSPVDWPLIPPLYAPGTPSGGRIDTPKAWTLLEMFETNLHRGDPTVAPGELWARAVAEGANVPDGSYVTRQIANQAKWFLADPSRLSETAVTTLLNASSAVVRTWALTEVVPRRRALSSMRPAPPPGIGRGSTDLSTASARPEKRPRSRRP